VPKLLEVEGLRTHFETSAGVVRAVDGISYDVGEGETVAVVGESGCGKSVGALSILRLIPTPPRRAPSSCSAWSASRSRPGACGNIRII
jgi:peptide/nickel transport system ATP-binding protein